MLSSADWAAMRADLEAVHADNATSITIRRGATTLAAQSVRITRGGPMARPATGPHSSEVRFSVIVAGSTTFDVEVGDRFNDAAGKLYEVIVVRPNRRVSVVAEAMLVE